VAGQWNIVPWYSWRWARNVDRWFI